MPQPVIRSVSVNPGKSVAVGAPTSFRGFHCTNLHTTETRYLMLFNLAALPANGAVPNRVWELGYGQTYEWDLPEGVWHDTGLVLALSTTRTSLTLVSADDACIDATYFPQ